MYDETTDRTNAARQKHAADKQADTQAALDSYQQSVTAAGGDPHRGLLNWAQTPEGHTAIGKNLMNSVIQLHSVMSSPDPNGQPRSIDVGNGLTGLATPDGKYHVFTPKQLEPSKEGKPEKPIMVGKQAYSRDPNDPNNLIPMTVGGREQAPPAAPVKVTPKAISDQIKDIDTILGSSQKMMANTGATGPLGTASFHRATAIGTPLGGPQGQAYSEAYALGLPALQRQLKAAGFSGKQLTEQAEKIWPSPGKATAYILNQQIPGVMLQYRTQLGDIYKSTKTENRLGGATEAMGVAQKYDAQPNYMHDIGVAISKLQTSPATLTRKEVGLLADESAQGRLPYDAVVKVHRQMSQLQMIPAEDLPKVAAADPNFAKGLDPAELRPDALPPLPRAQMGTGPMPQQPNIPPPINMPGGPGARLPQNAPQAPVQSQPGQPQAPVQQLPRQPPMGGEAQIPTFGPNSPTQTPNPQAQPQAQPPQQMPAPVPPQPHTAAPSFNPIGAAQAAEMPQTPSATEIGQSRVATVPPKAPVPETQAERPQAELTPEQQLLQADIAKAAQIAPDPKNADLIAATHQILKDTKPEEVEPQ